MDKDYIGTIIIVIAISLALGYAWGFHGGEQVAEQEYTAELQELTVIVRDDVCPKKAKGGI